MGSQPYRLIVTRPARDAGLWVKALENSGFKAQALPLIEIGAITRPADIEALHAAWHGLHDYAACMFVSGNAVQYFFKQISAASQYNQAQAAINNVAIEAIKTGRSSVRFWATGPGTAAALLDVGVPAAQIDAPPAEAGQFDSEALWQVVGQRDWQAKRVLVLRGQTCGAATPTAAGRNWLAQQLRAGGAQVDMLSVYHRFAPMLTDAQIQLAQAARQDGTVWLFSSSEAVGNLMQQPGLAGVDWRHACAVATHPRIAQALHAAGWGVVQQSRPTLPDIVDSVRVMRCRSNAPLRPDH